MGLINNGEVTKGFINDLNLLPGVSPVPNASSDFIQPTYDFSNAKFCDVVRSASNATAATITLFTTPSDRDFFLTAANLQQSLGALATTETCNITVVINGGTQTLLTINNVAGVGSAGVSVGNSYNPPIKLDRNTAISLTGGDANSSKAASIAGFTKSRN